MFQFERKHFEKCADHPLFQQGCRLAFLRSLKARDTITCYRGDRKLLKPLKEFEMSSKEWKDQAYTIFKDKPFAYVTPCMSPLETSRSDNLNFDYTLEAVLSIRRRNKLLALAKDRFEPSWYVIPHDQLTNTIFIIYPMLRILFPTINIFFWEDSHSSYGINNFDYLPDVGPNPSQHSDSLYPICEGDDNCIFNLMWQVLGDIPEDTVILNYTPEDEYINKYIKDNENSKFFKNYEHEIHNFFGKLAGLNELSLRVHSPVDRQIH